jgi:hypothetical protein
LRGCRYRESGRLKLRRVLLSFSWKSLDETNGAVAAIHSENHIRRDTGAGDTIIQLDADYDPGVDGLVV